MDPDVAMVRLVCDVMCRVLRTAGANLRTAEMRDGVRLKSWLLGPGSIGNGGDLCRCEVSIRQAKVRTRNNLLNSRAQLGTGQTLYGHFFRGSRDNFIVYSSRFMDAMVR